MFILAALNPARALSYVGAPLDVQLQEADIVIEGAVAEIHVETLNAFPLTIYTLDVTQSLLGTIESGRIEVVLPGGKSGEAYADAGAPTLAIGEQLMLIGKATSESRLRLPYWNASLFRESASGISMIANDGSGNPVIGLPCTGTAQVARPLADSPPGPDDHPILSDDFPVDNATFAVEPETLAMSWDALVDAMKTCLLEVPALGADLDGASP